MMMHHESHYRCPLCQQTLHFQDKQFSCANQHNFDQAKEGYVNLLPVQFKRSKQPGDNQDMVKARRDFLTQGYYQPLADKLLALTQNHNRILDAGCGEGYYTAQLKTANNHIYGVDIAKTAIKLAAKKYPQCAFSVATLSQLPFEDQLFDCIISVYAPIIDTEFHRLLKPHGMLITVTPAEQHLMALKALIYQQAVAHNTKREPITQLALIDQQQLRYDMHINSSEHALNLLAMTPFAFKQSPQLITQLKAAQSFICEADFLIRVYQKPALLQT